MKEKKDIVCDITTGVCGPVGENKGIMEFVDLSASKEEEKEEQKQGEKIMNPL